MTFEIYLGITACFCIVILIAQGYRHRVRIASDSIPDEFIADRSEIAYVLGLFGGVCLCLFGVSYLITGKFRDAFHYSLLGLFVWYPVVVVSFIGTMGLGLPVIIYFHLRLAIRAADRGSRRIPVPMFGTL